MDVKKKIEALYEENWGEWDETEDGFVEVENGEWEHNYKNYHNNYQVIREVATGNHYRTLLTREGDHYDGYEVTVDGVERVRPVQRIINSWVVDENG